MSIGGIILIILVIFCFAIIFNEDDGGHPPLQW